MTRANNASCFVPTSVEKKKKRFFKSRQSPGFGEKKRFLSVLQRLVVNVVDGGVAALRLRVEVLRSVSFNFSYFVFDAAEKHNVTSVHRFISYRRLLVVT